MREGTLPASDGDGASVSSLLTEANEYVSNRLKEREKKYRLVLLFELITQSGESVLFATNSSFGKEQTHTRRSSVGRRRQ
jgi:hypothetical protein